jgi:hypothetical protein
MKHEDPGQKLSFRLITVLVGILFLFAFLAMCGKSNGQSTCSSPAGTIIQNIYSPQCYAIPDTSDTLDLCFTFTAPGSILLFASVPPANCNSYSVSAVLYDSSCSVVNPSAFGIVFVIPGASYTWCAHYVCTGSSGFQNNFCPSYSDFSPLPVTWIYFFGRYNKISGCVDLRWATATETNCDFFEVQYSTDNERWWSFDKKDGAGNSSQPIYYHSTDCSSGPTGYYRVRQVDFDGKENFSTTINVVRDEPGRPVIYIYDLTLRLLSRTGDFTQLQPGIYIVSYNGEFLKFKINPR